MVVLLIQLDNKEKSKKVKERSEESSEETSLL